MSLVSVTDQQCACNLQNGSIFETVTVCGSMFLKQKHLRQALIEAQ